MIPSGADDARWVQDAFQSISADVEQPAFTDLLARSAGQPEVQRIIGELAAPPRRGPPP